MEVPVSTTANMAAPPASVGGANKTPATTVSAAAGMAAPPASDDDADVMVPADRAVDMTVDVAAPATTTTGDTAVSAYGRKRNNASISGPDDDDHAVTAHGARAAAIPSPKKWRSSCGPAHEARRKAFYASKEPRTTTSAPSTQIGAGIRGAVGRGV